MKKLPRCYWDSTCFIAWLKPEPDRRAKCQEVIRAAEKGELQIVTSAISLIEVVKLDKGPLQITQDKERKISDFFKHRYIVVVQVTRTLTELARTLIWNQGLRPKDAVHAATAISERLTDFHTFDRDFLKLDGKVGNPLLVIKEPHTLQPELPLQPPEEDQVE
jgi:predicted nucleic acid-binding protein